MWLTYFYICTLKDEVTTTDEAADTNDPDYVPEAEHAGGGIANSKFSGPVRFGERYNLSSFVIGKRKV